VVLHGAVQFRRTLAARRNGEDCLETQSDTKASRSPTLSASLRAGFRRVTIAAN
jgi:hypothetical protein